MNDKQTGAEKAFKVNQLPTGLRKQEELTEKIWWAHAHKAQLNRLERAKAEYPNKYYL